MTKRKRDDTKSRQSSHSMACRTCIKVVRTVKRCVPVNANAPSTIPFFINVDNVTVSRNSSDNDNDDRSQGRG